MTVGLAGCGTMGLPMVEALAVAGYSVRGLDIRPATDFVTSPVEVRSDVGWFCDGCETVFSLVRDIAQTEALLFGAQQLVANARSLKTLVISSTVAPDFLARLRQKLPDHIALIDAPMSGAPIAARERRLSFMLGGEAEEIAALMPMFQAMGREIHHMGGLGAGMSTKVLNNLVAASSVTATRFALAGAEAQGIDQQAMLNVLNSSSGQSWVSSNFDQIEWFSEGYDPANTMGILAKDVQSGREVCAEADFSDTLIDMIKKLPSLT